MNCFAGLSYAFIFTSQLACLFLGVRDTPNRYQAIEIQPMTTNITKRDVNRIRGWTVRLLFVVALCFMQSDLKAATFNISSLEAALAAPNDPNVINYSTWSGWMTQVFEYNMPLIQIANGPNDDPITTFRMSIGDTRYQFSNIFQNKDRTNSWNIFPTGEPALLGMTTPGVNFVSYVADGGDTLVVDFGNGGLQPGEVVRLQVDIDMDPGSVGTMAFADYTSVFFQAGGGADTTGNSVIEMVFANDQSASATLPNYVAPNAVSLTTPRPYDDMQMVDNLPALNVTDPGSGGNGNPDPIIPEPSSLLLGSLACFFSTYRRRSGN